MFCLTKLNVQLTHEKEFASLKLWIIPIIGKLKYLEKLKWNKSK